MSSFPGDLSGSVDTPTAHSCGYSPGLAPTGRTEFPFTPTPFGFDDQARFLNRMKFAASIEFVGVLRGQPIQQPPILLSVQMLLPRALGSQNWRPMGMSEVTSTSQIPVDSATEDRLRPPRVHAPINLAMVSPGYLGLVALANQPLNLTTDTLLKAGCPIV